MFLSLSERCNAFENSSWTRSSSRRIIKWALERGLKEIIEEIGERWRFRESQGLSHSTLFNLANSTSLGEVAKFFSTGTLEY